MKPSDELISDRDSNEETAEWRNASNNAQAFTDGRRDDEFSFPTRHIHIQDLARVLEEAGQPCKIYLKTDLTWLDNRYHARCWEVRKQTLPLPCEAMY